MPKPSLVDRGNNQHTAGLVHRVHEPFDASHRDPRRDRDASCTTTARCRCCYFLLLSTITYMVPRALLHTLCHHVSNCVASCRAVPNLTTLPPLPSPLDGQQQQHQPLSRHSFFCSLISSVRVAQILQLACVSTRAASAASYPAGTL